MAKSNEKAIEQLTVWAKYVGWLLMLGLLGILSSIIVWIWLGFWIFFKVLLTSIVVILIGQFFSKVIKGLVEALKKAKEKEE